MTQNNDSSRRLSRVLVLLAMVLLLFGSGAALVKFLAVIIGSIAAVLLVLDK